MKEPINIIKRSAKLNYYNISKEISVVNLGIDDLQFCRSMDSFYFFHPVKIIICKENYN